MFFDNSIQKIQEQIHKVLLYSTLERQAKQNHKTYQLEKLIKQNVEQSRIDDRFHLIRQSSFLDCDMKLPHCHVEILQPLQGQI